MAILKRFKMVAVVAATMLSMFNVADCQSISRERRELKMADQAVLASIAVSRSPKGKHLCSDDQLACVGPDKAELGLALIGARQTKASRSALIDLLGYRLDGAVAEDYSCYVLKSGSSIKQELSSANPAALSARCHTELDKLTRSRKASFEGSDEDSVCADPSSIKAKIEELARGITKNTKCSSEDF